MADDQVSQQVLDQIADLGFNNQNVQRTEGGYIVEGDIFVEATDLSAAAYKQVLRVGEVEQYRTTNLVAVNGSRVITVSLDYGLPTSYAQALDVALERYNDEGLSITFKRVSRNGDIVIRKAPGSAGYLASAGFPRNGNPHNQILVNSRYMGVRPDQPYLATILAHEIGHCIGFRHTDYMDRSYSCGGAYYNEGQSTVGAIFIPGTNPDADPNSWMLSCIGTGDDRPFNANDKTALDYLY